MINLTVNTQSDYKRAKSSMMINVLKSKQRPSLLYVKPLVDALACHTFLEELAKLHLSSLYHRDCLHQTYF